MKHDPNSGRPFFIDHKTRTTSWEDPRTQKAYTVSLSILMSCLDIVMEEMNSFSSIQDLLQVH